MIMDFFGAQSMGSIFQRSAGENHLDTSPLGTLLFLLFSSCFFIISIFPSFGEWVKLELDSLLKWRCGCFWGSNIY